MKVLLELLLSAIAAAVDRLGIRRPIDEDFMGKLLSLGMDDLIEDVRANAVFQVVSVGKNGTIRVLRSPKVGVTNMNAKKMAQTPDFRAIRKTDGTWAAKRQQFMMQS